MWMDIYGCMRIYGYICVFRCICVFVWIYMCILVCVCRHILYLFCGVGMCIYFVDLYIGIYVYCRGTCRYVCAPPPSLPPLSYDTKLEVSTSRPCGGVVIGKVWQVHMLGSIPVYDMYHFGLGQG